MAPSKLTSKVALQSFNTVIWAGNPECARFHDGRPYHLLRIFSTLVLLLSACYSLLQAPYLSSQSPHLFSHRGISFSSGDLIIKTCRSRETADGPALLSSDRGEGLWE